MGGSAGTRHRRAWGGDGSARGGLRAKEMRKGEGADACRAQEELGSRRMRERRGDVGRLPHCVCARRVEGRFHGRRGKAGEVDKRGRACLNPHAPTDERGPQHGDCARGGWQAGPAGQRARVRVGLRVLASTEDPPCNERRELARRRGKWVGWAEMPGEGELQTSFSLELCFPFLFIFYFGFKFKYATNSN
jgi:hypothetical protein